MLRSFGATVGRFFDALGVRLNRIPVYRRTVSVRPDYVWQKAPGLDAWLWPPPDAFVWSDKREWTNRYFGYHPVNWFSVARRFDRFR